MAQITPYLFYEDAEAAADFLTRAFGFEEKLREIGGAGGLHIELRLADEPVMIGQATWDYKNPKNSDNATAMVFAYVDDIVAIRERARSAGAEVVTELAELPNGDRRTDIRDPEGHMWSFAEAAG